MEFTKIKERRFCLVATGRGGSLFATTIKRIDVKVAAPRVIVRYDKFEGAGWKEDSVLPWRIHLANRLVEETKRQIVQILDRDGARYRTSLRIAVSRSLPRSLDPLLSLRRRMAFGRAVKDLMAEGMIARSDDKTYDLSRRKEDKGVSETGSTIG